MAIEPDHPIWKRERKVHHAGAIRPWLKERHDDGKLIGLFVRKLIRPCHFILIISRNKYGLLYKAAYCKSCPRSALGVT